MIRFDCREPATPVVQSRKISWMVCPIDLGQVCAAAIFYPVVALCILIDVNDEPINKEMDYARQGIGSGCFGGGDVG
jgi:hypothetical protein